MEVKTVFAYVTFQEIVHHLLFAPDMLCIAYLGTIFWQLQFVSTLRRVKDAEAKPITMAAKDLYYPAFERSMGRIYIHFTFFLQAIYYCLFPSCVRLVSIHKTKVRQGDNLKLYLNKYIQL